jgi:hypothetical protein
MVSEFFSCACVCFRVKLSFFALFYKEFFEGLSIHNENKRCSTRSHLKELFLLNETIDQHEFKELCCPILHYLRTNSECNFSANLLYKNEKYADETWPESTMIFFLS